MDVAGSTYGTPTLPQDRIGSDGEDSSQFFSCDLLEIVIVFALIMAALWSGPVLQKS